MNEEEEQKAREEFLSNHCCGDCHHFWCGWDSNGWGIECCEIGIRKNIDPGDVPCDWFRERD